MEICFGFLVVLFADVKSLSIRVEGADEPAASVDISEEEATLADIREVCVVVVVFFIEFLLINTVSRISAYYWYGFFIVVEFFSFHFARFYTPRECHRTWGIGRYLWAGVDACWYPWGFFVRWLTPPPTFPVSSEPLGALTTRHIVHAQFTIVW